MPINSPTPPAAAQAAFVTGLPSFLSWSGGLGQPKFVGAPPPIPTPAEIGFGFAAAVEIFVLGLNDAAHNMGTISPTPAGWQFFSNSTVTPPQPVSGVVTRDRNTHTWNLVNVYYGSEVALQLSLFSELDKLAEFKTVAYDLRLLQIPGVNVVALWLMPTQPGPGDYFLALPSISPQLFLWKPGQLPMLAADFLNTIRPLAANNLRMPMGYGA